MLAWWRSRHETHAVYVVAVLNFRAMQQGAQKRSTNMDRREFIKVVPLGALVSSQLLNQNANAQTGQTATKLPSSASGSGKMPDWVKAQRLTTTDMDGIGPDGKPDVNYNATRTGASRAGFKYDPSQPPHQMTLTKEEQDIMAGKKGKALAKVMKTVVAHGNAFGATKLVDLGGATHSSFFNGPPYIEALLGVFNECADEGLKTTLPYTINPRPFDFYNVQFEPDEMEMVFSAYSLQVPLDRMHNRLGGKALSTRSCACYLDEIGNAPKPGTYVAWAESSAVNFGNSVLGLRCNRNATGMELLCALLGKAPFFGLMTDEGRMAKWLIDVKTTKEPDWGVLGAAIGIKVSEDMPYIIGVGKYFGGEVTKENMHLLKSMGSSTAANGAVGLYHVEGVTPDAKAKGRDLLAKGHQTYVVDDAEIARVYKTYPNLWSKKDAKPTRCFIGCPHNTYHELLTWGSNVTEALKKRGQKKLVVPMQLFCATVVRDHLLHEHPVLVRDMKDAGMSFSNMCAVMFTGLKGYQETEFAVTNSNKIRKYSSSRYYSDAALMEIVLTGKMPT
jgi:predicted aconitase